MKITYNWLKEFVDHNYTPYELSDKLTMLGLEVELVFPVKLFFSGVIVGKILEIKPHPNAEKLVLCKVNTGKDTLQIVCGAKNISVGDLVPTAVIGAVLSDNTKIVHRNIRGIDSFGMLCSEKELGLNETASGIFILSPENLNGLNPKIGESLEKAIKLEDILFDINVTPNRPDALSLIGIAREISAISGKPLKSPKIYIDEKGGSIKGSIDINIKSPELCPRYSARIIKGINIQPSPFWIRYRLEQLGVRSVNNIVDITNFVLLELGQPLHAFDYNTISDKKIIVRTANIGEKITTIDNEQRILDKNMLVIADSKRSIAIAGVMGGKETEIGPNTKDILLESAYFEPSQIRRTSKRFGIISEASYRFERGIDPELQVIALNRTAQLIHLIAGGTISKGIIDIKKHIPKPTQIKTNQSFNKRVIGIDIPIVKTKSIIKSLGCKIKETNNAMTITPPSWRRDLTKKVDISEEIVRMFGYNKIPLNMPEALVRPPSSQKISKILKTLYRILTGMGLNEIITYSFINPKDITLLQITEEKNINITNPVDQNTSIMRPTLIPEIVNTIIHNFNRGNDSVHIFEIGKCFHYQDSSNKIQEDLNLGIGIFGETNVLTWNKSIVKPDFFYLKGILEEIFRDLFIKDYKFQDSHHPTFHPGKTCEIIVSNKKIGIFGELNPVLIKTLDVKDISRKIFIAELNITELLTLLPRTLSAKFHLIPKFPSVRRDISIILDKHRKTYDIIKLVQGLGKELIESIDIFDVYEGSPIPEGKKSVAYAVTYRHKERTLTDEEVDNIHDFIRHKILENIPGEIRE